MPFRPPSPCAHPGCPALTRERFCPQHKRAHEQARGSAAVRGYDAAWRRVRLQVLVRDGYRCRVCGSFQALQVHHLVPMSQGGAQLDPANLVTLCTSCHAQQHSGGG